VNTSPDSVGSAAELTGSRKSKRRFFFLLRTTFFLGRSRARRRHGLIKFFRFDSVLADVAYMPHPATHTHGRETSLCPGVCRLCFGALMRFYTRVVQRRQRRPGPIANPGFVFFGATVCKTVRPVLWDRCLSVCNVGVLWPNGWMDQDAAWYGGRLTRHCVRWVLSFPHGKGHSNRPPLFDPCLLWRNGRPAQQLLSTCLSFVE